LKINYAKWHIALDAGDSEREPVGEETERYRGSGRGGQHWAREGSSEGRR